MKKNWKIFTRAFTLTLMVCIFFIMIVITDFQCRKTITGDDSLPFRIEKSDNKRYLVINCLGWVESFEIA